MEYSLDIKNLSKSFRRGVLSKNSYSTLKSLFLNRFRKNGRLSPKLTRAVKDLTVRIPKGSSVGIIGRNGSGKSTLLKLITGIYKPDKGTVSVNGRVAALIELGAGFHPDFTGRENLILGGVMHGLTRAEIEERFSDIVGFAELSEVIDEPVRTYSSGMFMRLGFSLAVHTDPDILLIDEVLSVGDAAFVNRCKDKIGELRKLGKTLILVSHDLSAINMWSDEALWLHEGEVKDRGDPRRVIDHYLQFLEAGEEDRLIEEQHTLLSQPDSNGSARQSGSSRWGSREIEITGARILNEQGNEQYVFHTDDPLNVEIQYIVRERMPDTVFGVGINGGGGTTIHGTNTHIEGVNLGDIGGAGSVCYSVSRVGLTDGTYTIDVAVHRKDGYPYDYRKDCVKFSVRSSVARVGIYAPKHTWQIRRAEDKAVPLECAK